MAKTAWLWILALLLWTMKPTFLEGFARLGRLGCSRVARQARGEGRRMEKARRARALQGPRSTRKHPTCFADGLHQMHQASLKGDFKKAAKWFEELRAHSDFVVDASTITTVIQAAANLGRVEEATLWFKKFEEYDLNATLESYTSMISAAAKKKQIAKAEKYFLEMQEKGIKPDDVAYGAWLAAISRTGDLQRAEKYFTMMQRDGLKPNSIVWGTMLTAAANSEQGYRAALEWFGRMEDANIKPSVRDYTSLINGAKKSGDLQAAEGVLQKMGAAYVEPDAILYTAMMNAAAEIKGPELAQKYFEEMLLLNLEPTAWTYRTLLKAWFRARNMHGFLETFQRMQSAGFTPDVLQYTQAFHCLSRLNRVGEIEPILKDMLARRVKTDAKCRQTLKDIFGKAEYVRISDEFRIDRYGRAGFNSFDSSIEQKQKAKLDNMCRDQTKSALRPPRR